MDIGPTELILIAVVLLVLFGGKKLPELARGLGQAQREFKEGMRDESKSEPAAEPAEAADLPVADSTADTVIVDPVSLTTVEIPSSDNQS